MKLEAFWLDCGVDGYAQLTATARPDCAFQRSLPSQTENWCICGKASSRNEGYHKSTGRNSPSALAEDR